MKLSEWARLKGISYKTAYRLVRSSRFPGRVERLPTGTIIVSDELPQDCQSVVLYARVSAQDQKQDAVRQMRRIRDFCSSRGWTISKEVVEIGSGLNGHRKKLLSLLSDKSVRTIVVEHKDRLARFGFEMVEASMMASNRSIVVLNDSEFKDDLVQDFVDVVTSMCARIYGRRSAKNRANNAIRAAGNDCQ
jgi:putative resolvase